MDSQRLMRIRFLRVPHYSAQTLTQWMASSSMADVAQVYNYWLRRVELDVELLDEAELISHTTCVFSKVSVHCV